MVAISNLKTGEIGETHQAVVIGGGQAGLAVSYYLKRAGEDFIILDQHPRTGDAWRRRWDSLRLFTPSQFNNLPGKPFPRPINYYPTKDETADYLETYSQEFDLPVRHGVKVENLSRKDGSYAIKAGAYRFSARKIIVATGPYQSPVVPSFSQELEMGIDQLHSSLYQRPDQIPAQSVLVVGAGNSGIEIALELANAGKQVWLAGRDVGLLPITSSFSRLFDGRLLWWLTTNLLTLKTPAGRRMQRQVRQHGSPLGRTRRAEVAQAGAELTPRLAGVQAGRPQLGDGRLLAVEGVIWATGYRPDFSWIDLSIFGERGYPRHARGVVPEAPGLYFLGLLFQTGVSSSLLGGVGKDARYIAKQVRQIGR